VKPPWKEWSQQYQSDEQIQTFWRKLIVITFSAQFGYGRSYAQYKACSDQMKGLKKNFAKWWPKKEWPDEWREEVLGRNCCWPLTLKEFDVKVLS
jgi:hypothetical protein